ncbi:hypothetical protein C8R44DRAFT_733176 [Mycena epipterygia]|nr:hypothetical protein C8R44DRAFT_741083 [Mycena epipterygia]KAJ7127749.1 hypothetical protein C8R44DRAFT_733176 [Mycena epipterygia]
MPLKTKTDSEEDIEDLDELKRLLALKNKKIAAQNKTIGYVLIFSHPTATLQDKKHQKKLIPKPPGQAGRSPQDGGYNLQEAIGLGNDSDHYHRAFALVKTYTYEHLSILRTISKQERGRVEKTIRLIQKEVPFFERFENGWAIRDMMLSILANEQTRYRKRMSAEKAWYDAQEDPSSDEEPAKKLAKKLTKTKTATPKTRVQFVEEEKDNDADEEPLSDTSDSKTKNKRKNISKTAPKTPSKKRNIIMDSDDDELDLLTLSQKKIHPPTKPTQHPSAKPAQKRTQQKPKPSDNDEFPESLLDTNKEKLQLSDSQPKRKKEEEKPQKASKRKNQDDPSKTTVAAKKKTLSTAESSNKRKASDVVESFKPNKKTKLNSGQAELVETPEIDQQSPKKSQKKKQVALTWADLPACCPAALCKEALPKTPVLQILGLFNKAKDLKDNGGPKAQGLHFVYLEICQAITKEKRRDAVLQIGRNRQWPTTLHFKDMRVRIFDMAPVILDLFLDPAKLQTCPVWLDFLLSIKFDIYEFIDAETKYEFKGAFQHKKCGYYGSQGEFIINSCLMRLVAENEDEHQLEQSLCSTLHHIITETKEDLFGSYDDNSSSNYLTVKDFIEFVLVPFVAISLIDENMPGYNGTGLQDAIFERNNSNEFGEMFHSEEDNAQAHQVHQENVAAIRAIQRVQPSKLPAVNNGDEPDREEADDDEPETAPPRHRKDSIKKESLKIRIPPAQLVVEEEVTLDDFPSPKKKTPAKKKVQPKPRPLKKQKKQYQSDKLDTQPARIPEHL